MKGSTVTKLARCIIFALMIKKIICSSSNYDATWPCTSLHLYYLLLVWPLSFYSARFCNLYHYFGSNLPDPIHKANQWRMFHQSRSLRRKLKMNSGLPLQKVLVRQFTGQQKAMVELQSAVRMAYAKNKIFPFMAVTCSLSNSSSSIWYPPE